MSLDVQPLGQPFDEVLHQIEAAKQRAYQAVNTTLIELYWQVGEFISRKLVAAEWGDGGVDQLATYITQTQPSLKGFTRANLFRMRQLYETISMMKKSHHWCDNYHGRTI